MSRMRSAGTARDILNNPSVCGFMHDGMVKTLDDAKVSTGYNNVRKGRSDKRLQRSAIPQLTQQAGKGQA